MPELVKFDIAKSMKAYLPRKEVEAKGLFEVSSPSSGELWQLRRAIILFILSTCLFVDDEGDAVFLDVHFLAFFDEGVRTDDGIGDHRILVDEGAIHDDGVRDLRAFFDDDIARDYAMVDFAKDD